MLLCNNTIKRDALRVDMYEGKALEHEEEHESNVAFNASLVYFYAKEYHLVLHIFCYKLLLKSLFPKYSS